MPPTNIAAFLSSPKSPTLTIAPAPYSSPAAGELVIKTHAVALNPADWVIQRLGLLIPEDDGYPCVIGCDVAGEVIEVCSNPADDDEFISQFKVGDRVIGQTGPRNTKDAKDFDLSSPDLSHWHHAKKIYANAAFQNYVVLNGPMLAKIPDHVSYEDAVVLPLGIATAASCLFPARMLNLDMPPIHQGSAVAKNSNKVLLIWGASSSIGSCGVQLAHQAGYSVVAICSARNHAMVTSLGAVKCFDYADPDMVSSIVSFIQTFNGDGDSDDAGVEVVGAYDAISNAATITPMCEILHTLHTLHTSSSTGPKTRPFIAAIYPGAEALASKDVQVVVNISVGLDAFYATAAKIRVWLEAALVDGRVKCMPEKEVLGHGFDKIQAGMDRLAEKKVSARKLVVTV